MATTEDMAPSRTSPARKRTNGSTRSSTPRRRSSRAREDDLERQFARLQDDLKAIAGSVAKLADDKVSEARGAAQSEARKLVKTGEQAVDQIQDEFGHMEKQIKDTIREKPLTAVAGAVAIGFVLALITR
jgi:ElaB/YqjD/DUF883 family membrane-anchored ribosome-binding protein